MRVGVVVGGGGLSKRFRELLAALIVHHARAGCVGRTTRAVEHARSDDVPKLGMCVLRARVKAEVAQQAVKHVNTAPPTNMNQS